MKNKFIVLFLVCVLVLLVLIGASCWKGEEEEQILENENVNYPAKERIDQNVNISQKEQIKELEEASEEIESVNFVPYTNKAMNYTILRPDRWYWQHFTKGELAEVRPDINDYFITDPKPLPGFETDFLGQMFIEVSEKDREELAKNLDGFVVADAKVGGFDAKRYEGIINNEIAQNKKVIEYHFEKGGKTFRLVYNKINGAEKDEAIFEKMVKSFEFNK